MAAAVGAAAASVAGKEAIAFPRGPVLLSRGKPAESDSEKSAMALHRIPENDSGMGIGATVADRRAAAIQRDEERAAERRKQLEAQASPLNEPHERIRIWEQVHALPLPAARRHRLIGVIAAQTGLTLEQVHEEQQRRAQPAPAPAQPGA